MPRLIRAHRVLVLVAVLAACGSGSGETIIPETTTTTPAATTTPTSTTAALLPAAPDLTSYRYRSVTDITITELAGSTRFLSVKTGDFVAPNRHYVNSTLELGGNPQPMVDVVAIGADTYLRSGGDWEPASRSDPNASDALGGLTSLNSDLVPNQLVPHLSAFASSEEQLGEVQAQRYDLGRPEFDRLRELSGVGYFEGPVRASDELRFSIWRDVDLGSIVRVELEVNGPAAVLGGSVAGSLSADATVAFLVTVELSDVNDPSITVDRPAVPEG